LSENNCSSCGSGNRGTCPGSATCGQELPKPKNINQIKQIIAIMSGKGGVGKSTVTAMLAVGLARRGYQVGILDADITGSSIPRMLGVGLKRLDVSPLGLIPAQTRLGIKLVSMNLLLQQESDPVIWRGPMVAGIVKQFWEEVAWGSLDYLLVDLPPGTGDVPLTVLQTLPVNGVLMVSTPQQLVQMIVQKTVKMAQALKVPIIGLVENLSYVACPNCQEQIPVFGISRGRQVAADQKIPLVAALPFSTGLSELADQGKMEEVAQELLDPLVEALDLPKKH